MPVRIVEWKLPYTWWTWIEITSDKVINLLLREENNLIMVNDDNEVYTDLQLESGLTPSSDFPVWVTVWKVLQTDWWTQSWLILNWKTTSWDYARWIYANDWKLYFDNGTWTWKKVYYSTDVDTLLTNLRNEVYQYFIQWSDFERDEQNNANVILSLTTQTTPTEDFTVSAPSTVRAWQEYVLRVISTETAYVMTLWQWIVNPKQVDINLHTHTTDTYVFLALDDWTLELQPIVSEWANPNDWVLTIQKNGTTVATFTANQATNTTANITVPTVVDNLTTQSSTNALSANQWYELKWMIDDLAGFGKFLSLWNATTWMPISFPLSTPYTYSTWDYFVVEVVSTATPPVNYRPNWSSYTWTASSTAETDELEVWDVYVYDGSVWLLQSNHWKTVSFWNIAWDPYDNTNLWNALNAKQDVLTAWANITIDPVTNEISASNTTYSNATTTTAWIVKLWSDTAIAEAIQSPAWATNKTYPVQLNASGQMWVNVPRANTTYGAWDNITIDWNNNINADVNTKTFYLSSTSDLTNAQAAYDWYIAWNNPIIVLNWINYIGVWGDSWAYVLMSSKQVLATANTNDYSIAYQEALKLTLSSWTVTAVILWTSSLSDEIYVLDTATNYSTPYTPQYDGSPATKKYVDDHAWSNYTAWDHIDITNDTISVKMSDTIYNTQWPAPTWYHVPSKDENVALIAAMTALGIDTSNWNCMKTYMKMPFAGSRGRSSAGVDSQGTDAFYWSYTASGVRAYFIGFYSAGLNTQGVNYRSNGFSVRCFKNSPTIPTASWTTLFDWSGIAANAWIFHNTTDWLISISSDWTNRITIQDKNLWATTVYNDGDTLSQANCWNYYQWWNNYGFAWTGSVTTSSTKVDASWYWPWNRYSSSTFITVSTSPYDWSSVQNDNLWWWEYPSSQQTIITNDTTWTTTTVTKIWAGTEAEYALITPDANTIYHIY